MLAAIIIITTTTAAILRIHQVHKSRLGEQPSLGCALNSYVLSDQCYNNRRLGLTVPLSSCAVLEALSLYGL